MEPEPGRKPRKRDHKPSRRKLGFARREWKDRTFLLTQGVEPNPGPWCETCQRPFSCQGAYERHFEALCEAPYGGELDHLVSKVERPDPEKDLTKEGIEPNPGPPKPQAMDSAAMVARIEEIRAAAASRRPGLLFTCMACKYTTRDVGKHRVCHLAERAVENYLKKGKAKVEGKAASNGAEEKEKKNQKHQKIEKTQKHQEKQKTQKQQKTWAHVQQCEESEGEASLASAALAATSSKHQALVAESLEDGLEKSLAQGDALEDEQLVDIPGVSAAEEAEILLQVEHDAREKELDRKRETEKKAAAHQVEMLGVEVDRKEMVLKGLKCDLSTQETEKKLAAQVHERQRSKLPEDRSGFFVIPATEDHRTHRFARTVEALTGSASVMEAADALRRLAQGKKLRRVQATLEDLSRVAPAHMNPVLVVGANGTEYITVDPSCLDSGDPRITEEEISIRSEETIYSYYQSQKLVWDGWLDLPRFEQSRTPATRTVITTEKKCVFIDTARTRMINPAGGLPFEAVETTLTPEDTPLLEWKQYLEFRNGKIVSARAKVLKESWVEETTGASACDIALLLSTPTSWLRQTVDLATAPHLDWIQILPGERTVQTGADHRDDQMGAHPLKHPDITLRNYTLIMPHLCTHQRGPTKLSDLFCTTTVTQQALHLEAHGPCSCPHAERRTITVNEEVVYQNTSGLFRPGEAPAHLAQIAAGRVRSTSAVNVDRSSPEHLHGAGFLAYAMSARASLGFAGAYPTLDDSRRRRGLPMDVDLKEKSLGRKAWDFSVGAARWAGQSLRG